MRIYAKQSEQSGSGRDELDGVVLGQRRQGDRVLPVRNGQVAWSFDQLRQPALVLGASGKGKTETTMRILHQVAEKTEMPVYFLDAKGDRETAERFVGLMEATGRRVRVFPNERFDGWRGDWKAIVDRLMQVVPYATAEGAAYYRDAAKAILQAACTAGGAPPRSSVELLRRLTKVSLADVTSAGPPLELSEELIAQTRMRYVAFFRQIGAALDGRWAWEDADAAYFLLDSIGGEEEASSAAAFLFADFGHYFKKRKPREQKCVLAVDEFSAIARRSDVAMLVEQARGFETFLLLAPQTVSGMGSPEQQSRILGSVDMLICHGTKEPGRIAELAGERKVPVLTQHYEEGCRTGESHLRLEDLPRLQADRIRELQPGDAWLIRDNKAMKVTIARAPQTQAGKLPEPEDTEVSWNERQLSEKGSTPYGKAGERIGDED